MVNPDIFFRIYFVYAPEDAKKLSATIYLPIFLKQRFAENNNTIYSVLKILEN